ncbi:hypothetical protein RvY_18768-5 [Ramazzottius varieornatus]|uniref:Uncharacterized protein n=1 Tax=Ramazzottius varieornatus TaxID=947166 RepID=A0A1D1W9X5_RAMVA|nr:hypothetical protein RvY_18768-5 [Ramazzottius varieornatus]
MLAVNLSVEDWPCTRMLFSDLPTTAKPNHLFPSTRVPFSGPCEAPGVSSSSPFQEMTWKSNDQTMSRFEDKTFDYGFPTPGKKNVRVIEEETCFSSAVWSSSR